jgi:drug/metabolite transporter (DMT)-like permease
VSVAPDAVVPAAAHAPSARRGLLFLGVTVCGWGLTWPINKVILESMSPYWMSAFRAGIATVMLLAIALPRGRLVVPTRKDMPVVLSITLLHMVGFAVLAAIGLQLVPVGRSVVLAYTTPLWVMPGAALFLGERLTPRRVMGVVLGMIGLGFLFNPFAFDWSDRNAVLGHAALLVAALLWAASILHNRGHQWRATPFQLAPWEMMLATVLLLIIALLSDSWHAIAWDTQLVLLLIVSSTVGSALPFWTIAMAGRNLPALSVSMGLLVSPVIGILIAIVGLGEAPDAAVLVALALVIGGVVLGTVGAKQ